MTANIEPNTHRLPYAHLRLSVIDVLDHPDLSERTSTRTLERLWREDPEDVVAVHDELFLIRAEPGQEGRGRHGLRAERMRELHRPMSARRQRGLTVAEISTRIGMRQETVARLLEHHGYLELSPFGRDQSRRLVTAECYAAGHGHNVDPRQIRSRRLDGVARAVPFPVFYEDKVASIVWTFGWDLLQARLAVETTKRKRLAFLLSDHAYLPDAEIASLAGCSSRGVEEARRRGEANRPRPATVAA